MREREEPVGGGLREVQGTPRRAFDVEPSQRRYRLRLARYRFLPTVLNEHLPTAGARVLDVGCGRGRLPLYWRRWGSAQKTAGLVAIEVSPLRLESARSRGYDLLVRADLASSWPVADRAFDAVVCEQVLEHFGDEGVDAVLSEVFRILKPGGVALIGVPIFWKLTLRVMPALLALRTRWRSLRGRRQASHLQQFSLGRLRTLLQRHGFSVESTRGFRVITLPWNWLEDFEWYYRLQRWVGSRFPRLSIEVTLVCRRPPESSRIGANASR